MIPIGVPHRNKVYLMFANKAEYILKINKNAKIIDRDLQGENYGLYKSHVLNRHYVWVYIP